jgi:hypothetical protein
MDNAWYTNPKFLMLADDGKWRAITVFWSAIGWAGSQGSDGYIPYFALSRLHGTKRQAEELISVRLWHPAEGGWQINDYRDYQQSTAETEARSKRARDAAYVRWHGKNGHT